MSLNTILWQPHFFTHVVVIQSLSCVLLLATLWTTALHAWLSSTISWVCSNSSPLSWWCYLTHLSICYPFLVSPSIFPSISSSFPINQLFLTGSQIMGASALASVLPMNIQDWFSLGLTGLILQSNGLSSVFPSTTIWNHEFFGNQPSLWSNSHICIWLLEKKQNKTKQNIALTIWNFVGKWSLCHTCTTCQKFGACKVSHVWICLFVTTPKFCFIISMMIFYTSCGFFCIKVIFF